MQLLLDNVDKAQLVARRIEVGPFEQGADKIDTRLGESVRNECSVSTVSCLITSVTVHC